MTARLLERRALVAALRPWVDAQVLTSSDVMAAATVCQLADEFDPLVALGAGLAVRAPRSGHVALDPFRIEEQILADVEHLDPDSVSAVLELDWPADPTSWLARLVESPVTIGPSSPLVVEGGLIYLRRFYRQECRVADRLVKLAAASATTAGDLAPIASVLTLDQGQLAAVQRCLAGQLGVLTGGPGTGKTRTVAALLTALLMTQQSPDVGELRIALAAPTGKAAARMGESIAASFDLLRSSGDSSFGAAAEQLAMIDPSTIHRLLGVRGGGRFWHDAKRPLPHDVVIIDEASMVSLSMMDALLDALRPGARLVLVGDPNQLASVEAGSVLGDIATASGVIAERVTELTVSRRFPAESRIGRFAAAIRAGDVAAADQVFPDTDDGSDDGAAVLRFETDAAAVASTVVEYARSTMVAGQAGDAPDAIDGLERLRVLCAHRRGRAGVSYWNQLVESSLSVGGRSVGGMYPGRPLMVTRNDASRGLFNGDLGVVVRTDDGDRVAFGPSDPPRLVAPAHLDAVETVHAMTIHKSQGSEFDEVVVVLPSPDSRLATRDLLYTAVTRARVGVTLVGDRATIAAAIARPVIRTSALRDRISDR